MTRAQVPAPDTQLTGDLLKSVSRSFYLSLRLLPGALRKPVSLAYLLARGTDTLADTVQVPAETRREKLKALASAICLADENPGRDLARGFAGFQTNQSERALITLIPECLRELARLPELDRAEIQTVLTKITRAQELDLERFGDGAQVRRALESAAQLDDYTYLIAGCVGEFWTEMCFQHLPGFADLSKEEMRALGREYGCGLQLVNILRDSHADLRAGRCYLPADELRENGISPGDILIRPAGALPVIDKWLAKAEGGLKAGMKYVNAIRHRRVRIATALPALIGIRTIKDLRTAGDRLLREKIKISRSAVRTILARAAVTMGSRRVLRQMFEDV
jgi:farnesyl-diphosphate farnesyltransferase